MIRLRKIYLSIHATGQHDTSPGGEKSEEWELFPGRCENSYRSEVKRKDEVYRLIRDAGEDEGIFILPTHYNAPTIYDLSEASKELVGLAEQHFGSRCVVCRINLEWDRIRQVLGELWGSFFEGLREDLQQAIKNRGLPEWELVEPKLP